MEFLLILAIAIVILTAIFILSSSKLNDIGNLKNQNDASNAVLDLDSAAKQVYAEGPGAKEQVYVNLPSNYDSAKSYVGNSSIIL